MTDLDDFLDSLFFGCAFKAFVEEAQQSSGPPCPDRTRARAYSLYEVSLAEKNGPTTSRPECYRAAEPDAATDD